MIKITFCNINPYKTIDNKSSLVRDTHSMINSWVASGFDSLSVMTDASYNMHLAPFNHNGSFANFDLEDMLISCTYNNYKCSKEHFNLIYTNNYGNCYQVFRSF